MYGTGSVNIQSATRDTMPEDVETYLRENPDCIAQRPDLLRVLTPPTRFNGEDPIADFQNAMIQGLRSDLDRLSRTSNDILSMSRSNLSQQQRTHAAALLLTQAATPAEFHRVLTQDWPRLLDVDAVALILEDDAATRTHEGPSGIARVPRGYIDGVFRSSDNPQVFLSAERYGNRLFGDYAAQIKSDALARIDIPANWEYSTQTASQQNPVGLLAVGSFQTETFHPDQATDLLEFLARLLSTVLVRWCAPTP